MVENQCGSSDIPQSTAANVTVRPKRSMTGPEMSCIFRRMRGSPDASCSADQRFSLAAKKTQTAKYMTARMTKKSGLR